MTNQSSQAADENQTLTGGIRDMMARWHFRLCRNRTPPK